MLKSGGFLSAGKRREEKGVIRLSGKKEEMYGSMNRVSLLNQYSVLLSSHLGQLF